MVIDGVAVNPSARSVQLSALIFASRGEHNPDVGQVTTYEAEVIHNVTLEEKV